MTPSQAGVLLFLRRHPETKVTDAADSLVVRVPTVCDVLNDLVQKRWVTKPYSVEDRRVMCVQLSRRGYALAPPNRGAGTSGESHTGRKGTKSPWHDPE